MDYLFLLDKVNKEKKEMKRLFTLLVFALFVNVMFAQTVPEEQKSLITKVTATWCSNCGSWGWTFYEDLITDNDDKAIMVAAHYSGSLENTVGTEWSSNLGATSQPRFILNNTDQNVLSNATAARRTEIAAAVTANATMAPIVNAAVDVYDDGTFNVKTQFFQNATGDYYTSVYVIEENVIANQAGNSSGSNTSHHDILRAAVTPTTFGDMTGSGTINSGAIFDNTYNYTLNSGWNMDNLHFAAIVWEKVGDKYEYVNGSITNSITPANPTAVKDLSNEIKVSVQPNIIKENAQLVLELDEQKDLEIRMVNLLGQEVKAIHSGNLNEGKQIFEIQKENISNGIYFIQISSEGKTLTEKIIFQ